jgi:hypothetical protein
MMAVRSRGEEATCSGADGISIQYFASLQLRLESLFAIRYSILGAIIA